MYISSLLGNLKALYLLSKAQPDVSLGAVRIPQSTPRADSHSDEDMSTIAHKLLTTTKSVGGFKTIPGSKISTPIQKNEKNKNPTISPSLVEGEEKAVSSHEPNEADEERARIRKLIAAEKRERRRAELMEEVRIQQARVTSVLHGGSARFVAVDVEAWERNTKLVTEVA